MDVQHEGKHVQHEGGLSLGGLSLVVGVLEVHYVYGWGCWCCAGIDGRKVSIIRCRRGSVWRGAGGALPVPPLGGIVWVGGPEGGGE